MTDTSLLIPSPGLWGQGTLGQGPVSNPLLRLIDHLQNPPPGTTALPDSALRELSSLAGERDSTLLAEGLLAWAQRQENEERLESALFVYQSLGETAALPGVSPNLAARSLRRRQAILGGGGAGERIEFLGRRLARQATDPVLLLGMGVGSAVFSSFRAASLARLLANPEAGCLTRGFGARALASSSAFLAELPAFWGTTKGLNELIHPGVQRWDAETNFRELAGLGLTLGALKLSGAAAGGLSQRTVGTAGRSPGLSGAFNQLGMYGGIMSGHYLESLAGLRPHVDTGTALIDGLGMLIQFNVGGRLMGDAFPELTRYNHELNARSRLLEVEGNSLAQPWFRTLQEWGAGPGSGLSIATAMAGGRSNLAPPGGAAEPGGPREARDLVLQMSNTGDDAGGGQASPGVSFSMAVPAGRESPLPLRTGNSRDRAGQVTDPFEPTRFNPPNKVLRAFLARAKEENVDPQAEILRYTPFSRTEIQKVNPEHLGRGLGLALQVRIREIAAYRSAAAPGGNFESLPQTLRQALVSADEMVGMVEYFRRTNQTEVLDAYRAAVEPSTLEEYEPLKETLIRFLGPHFDRPLEPNEGILSIGSGDMMALLALYRHRVMPGELSWRTPIMVHARQQIVADEINERGTYADKLKGVQINFAGDPPIVAVGPNGLDYHGRRITQRDLHRTFRLQILSVPSDKLHEILTQDYFTDLPRDPILFEVIGAFIGKENRGEYSPQPNQRETVLPYQLINQAQETHGRPDARVVSGGGFIPGKILWRGERVEMVFAGPESEMEEHVAPEAAVVARTFAGKGLESPFLTAAVTHHQHSTELGKAMKNVTSLMGGFEAAQLVHRMITGAIRTANPKGEYETQVREPLFNLMLGLLRFNEGFEDHKATYRQEVRNDYWRCTDIDMGEVDRVLRLADNLPVTDPRILQDFLTHEIVDNPLIAATRNPKRGIAEFIIQMWRAKGSPYRAEELLPRGDDGKPRMTQEGINSLGPLMRCYSFRDHPIEQRRFEDPLYRVYQIFKGREPEGIPIRIPETITAALRGEFPEIRPELLRRILEGRVPRAIETLAEALHRFRRIRRVDATKFAEGLKREEELITHLIEAMKRSNPVHIARVPNAILRAPYGNMFRIGMSETGVNVDTYHAFIRVDGEGIRERMTQLGMFLRSFPEETRATIEVQVSEGGPVRDFQLRAELEFMVRSILNAFAQSRSRDEIEVVLNRTRILPDPEGREAVNDSYFQRLLPLVERLNKSSPSRSLTPQMIRNAGPDQAKLLDNLLQRSPGWPMLLGYFGGPINRAIKSALTRPERGTFFGILANGRMVDSFMVYRNPVNIPMVLSHHLTRQLENGTPDPNRGALEPQSIDFFDGMDLDRFLLLYERHAEERSLGKIDYRLLDVRSLPLESALVDEIDGVNAALLRIFLEGGENPPWAEARNHMLSEITPLYERPMSEIRAPLVDILNRYLTPFYEHDPYIRAKIDETPIFQYLQKRGTGSFRKLVWGNSDDAE